MAEPHNPSRPSTWNTSRLPQRWCGEGRLALSEASKAETRRYYRHQTSIQVLQYRRIKEICSMDLPITFTGLLMTTKASLQHICTVMYVYITLMDVMRISEWERESEIHPAAILTCYINCSCMLHYSTGDAKSNNFLYNRVGLCTWASPAYRMLCSSFIAFYFRELTANLSRKLYDSKTFSQDFHLYCLWRIQYIVSYFSTLWKRLKLWIFQFNMGQFHTLKFVKVWLPVSAQEVPYHDTIVSGHSLSSS